MADNNSSGFYVYVHRRATDGRVFYVGKGTGNRAWSLRRNGYWKNIANKHGFTIEIVIQDMREPDAFQLERELIAFYGRENLANLTDGGEGCSGIIQTEEHKAKVASAHRGMKRSEESRKRMSDAQKLAPKRDISGDKNPAKRPEVREKMRGLRATMNAENNPMSNPEYKAKLMAIMQTPEYRQKVSAGVLRSFENQARRDIASANALRIFSDQTTKAKHSESLKKFNAENRNKVLCIETGQVFGNQSEAARWLRVNGHPKATVTNISSIVRGIGKSAYGYTWRYA